MRHTEIKLYAFSKRVIALQPLELSKKGIV